MCFLLKKASAPIQKSLPSKSLNSPLLGSLFTAKSEGTIIPQELQIHIMLRMQQPCFTVEMR